METTRICQQCRQPLPANAPEGLCPACLAKVALGTEPTAPGATVNISPMAGQAATGTRVPPDVTELAAQFPQLEIIELLGMGGMGMVYQARQPQLDRLVALKILPLESAPHPSFAERFSREAKALAKLNHPGIVNVYDFGRSGQYYYFVMEYVDGMNLRQLLRSQTIEPRQALELVGQICTALQFAHDEGVVHRDIKPENILINKKGRVKIADFGLAKLLGAAPDTALTMSQAAMGTMNYMAPEQRQNAQGVDHRADIYSLGVVFYEMLTGEVPMGRFEPPSKRVQVDVRLDEVVLRALEREPARRYQQASEIKSGVETITSSTPEAPLNMPAGHAPAQAARVRFPYSDVISVVLFLLALFVAELAWQFMPLLGTVLFLAILLVATFKLSSRWQVQHARENGLWPQVGELPTLEHVRRLAQSREKVLAIKLYRQIHGGSLVDAKAAVAKLADRPSQTHRAADAPTPVAPLPAPVSAGKAPRWFWVRVYGLFVLGWLVTKMLWNFRGLGCWLACIGMAGLVVWVSLKRTRFFPEQWAIYSKTAPSKRMVALAVPFLILLLGFVALISGLCNFWEKELMHRNFTAKSAEQYEAEYKGREFHLLQRLPALSQDIPNVEMSAGPGRWSGGWAIGWGKQPPGQRWFNAVPNLLLGGYIMLWCSFGLIVVWRRPGMKLRSLSWHHVRASLALGTAILGSGLTICLFSDGAYLFSGRFGQESKSFYCQRNIEEVTAAIQKWADQNGYAMGDDHNWYLNTVPKGNRVAEARLREAWKASPFDRWQSTLTTFRRVSPHLAFELVSSLNPVETQVMVTGTMDCSLVQIANGTCHHIPEDLDAVLKNLQSAPSQAPGGNDAQPAKDR